MNPCCLILFSLRLSVAMCATLAILVSRALDYTLHELRQSVDGLVSAEVCHIFVAEGGVAEQVHGVQELPLLQEVIQRVSGEELDGV